MFDSCTDLSTAPSRVDSISLTKTMRYMTPALRVEWTKPQSDVEIFQYLLQYRNNGTTFWRPALIISPPATSYILAGLVADTEYSIRVRAVSSVGAGQWSDEQTERTYNSA